MARVVIALGGNALGKTPKEQMEMIYLMEHNMMTDIMLADGQIQE